MATAIQRYTYKTATVRQFNFTMPVAQENEGVTQWLPIRHFCLWLGIDSRSQIATLKADGRYDEALREIPYLTGTGWRTAMWIRRDKLARWLLDIDAKRCKLGSREDIEEFQAAVLKAAEALLFGASAPHPTSERGVLAHSERHTVRFACPDCGAAYLITIEDGEGRYERE